MKAVVNYVKQICGPSKVPGGNRPQEVFLLGSWAFFALIGLFIPENILRDHVWARDFTDAVASIVPQIDRITALNLKPDINRFHYSFLWVVSPVYFTIIMISGNKNVTLDLNQLTYGQIAGSLTISCILFAFSMFLWYGIGFMESDNGTTRIMFDYTVTRTICAPLFAFAPSVLFGGVLLIVKGMVTGHIFKESRG